MLSTLKGAIFRGALKSVFNVAGGAGRLKKCPKLSDQINLGRTLAVLLPVAVKVDVNSRKRPLAQAVFFRGILTFAGF
jgi:hypothetical protein